jgi:hypothetical protein
MRSTTPAGCWTLPSSAPAWGATSAPLVVAVSDWLYQEVVRHGYGRIDPASYRPIRFTSKDTAGRAWVHAPGDPAAPNRAGVTVPADQKVAVPGGAVRFSGHSDSDLPGAIVAAYASVLTARTPGELDNAAAKVQALVRKIRPSVYWQPLKSSNQAVVLDDVIQQVLDKRPDLESLAMDQAWLRAKTERSNLALKDYARIAGRFGASRSQALLEAATILMHIGDYAESIAMLSAAVWKFVGGDHAAVARCSCSSSRRSSRSRSARVKCQSNGTAVCS